LNSVAAKIHAEARRDKIIENQRNKYKPVKLPGKVKKGAKMAKMVKF
jgi:hypothetical protein